MNEKKKVIPEASAETMILFSRLQKAEVGESIQYSELSELLGEPVSGSYGPLQTAKQMALREGMVFECIRGEGIKRLDDQGIVKCSSGATDKVRRLARRERRKLQCVDVVNLNGDTGEYLTNISMLGLLTEITKPAKVRAISMQCADTKDALPMATAKMLEALK